MQPARGSANRNGAKSPLHIKVQRAVDQIDERAYQTIVFFARFQLLVVGE